VARSERGTASSAPRRNMVIIGASGRWNKTSTLSDVAVWRVMMPWIKITNDRCSMYITWVRNTI
jgi:hypothetical protein